MESERQLMHFAVGIITIAFMLIFGIQLTRGAVFFVVIIGLLLINLKVLKWKIGFVDWFIEKFERENVLLPGFGSAAYALGVLIPLVFLSDIMEISAVILVLALGDGISTLIGKNGKIQIPYNKKKTVEGSLAFFISSLITYFIIKDHGLIIAFVGAIVESLPLDIDDNISIPIVITLILVIL